MIRLLIFILEKWGISKCATNNKHIFIVWMHVPLLIMSFSKYFRINLKLNTKVKPNTK